MENIQFMPELTNEQYISVSEICNRLRVSRQVAYTLIKRGLIPSVKMVRMYRIRVEDFRAFLSAGGVFIAEQIGGNYGKN